MEGAGELTEKEVLLFSEDTTRYESLTLFRSAIVIMMVFFFECMQLCMTAY